MPVLLDETQENMINCDINPNLADFFAHGIYSLPHDKGKSLKMPPKVLAAMIAQPFKPQSLPG